MAYQKEKGKERNRWEHENPWFQGIINVEQCSFEKINDWSNLIKKNSQFDLFLTAFFQSLFALKRIPWGNEEVMWSYCIFYLVDSFQLPKTGKICSYITYVIIDLKFKTQLQLPSQKLQKFAQVKRNSVLPQ